MDLYHTLLIFKRNNLVKKHNFKTPIKSFKINQMKLNKKNSKKLVSSKSCYSKNFILMYERKGK